MQKVTVNLSKELVAQIDRLARQRAVKEERPISRTDIMSAAIEHYLAWKESFDGEQHAS